LGRPSKEDAVAILDAIADAERSLPELLAGEFQLAMNRLHTAP
jgi:PTH1 family peptidyl-tRNA hydrolase